MGKTWGQGRHVRRVGGFSPGVGGGVAVLGAAFTSGVTALENKIQNMTLLLNGPTLLARYFDAFISTKY